MNNMNIIGAEGTNEALQSAFNNFAQQTGVQTNAPEQPVVEQPAQTADEPKVQQATDQQPAPTQQNQTEATNKAFAQMRISNNEMTQRLAAIEKALQAQGHTNIDSFLAQQQNAEIQSKAQQQGISPDIEKRLQALELENQRYRENARLNALNQQVGSLVQKYGITKDQWQNFAQQVSNKGINVLESNVSLEALYLEYNMDAVMNQRIEAEKQKWLAEMNKPAQSAPITTPIGVTHNNINNNNKVDMKQLAASFANSKK